LSKNPRHTPSTTAASIASLKTTKKAGTLKMVSLVGSSTALLLAGATAALLSPALAQLIANTTTSSDRARAHDEEAAIVCVPCAPLLCHLLVCGGQ
jgi:hypothetical protein